MGVNQPLHRSGMSIPEINCWREACLYCENLMRLFSQVGPVVLFVAALYYRFARRQY